ARKSHDTRASPVTTRTRRARVDHTPASDRRPMSPLRLRTMQELPRRVSWGRRCVLAGAAATLVLSACSLRGAADPSPVGARICRLAHNWREDVHLFQHLRRADPREPTALTRLAVRFRSFEDAPAETALG